MSESIYTLVENYIRESNLAFVKRDEEGQLGVVFKDEGEFIPFKNLGYSSRLGFYRLSSFPDEPNESHKPDIEEVFFTSGRFLEGADDYEYLAILATDFTDGWIIGSWPQVEKVYHLLGRLLESRQPDEEISEFDERLGSKWLSVTDAALKYGVSVATVRRVVDEGKIKEAKKQGSTWRFPENHFRSWYYRHYQANRSPVRNGD